MENWTQEQAIAFETARECITDMMAICTGKLVQERAKAVPDASVVAALRAERTRLAQERVHLRVADDEGVARINEEYGQVVRQWRLAQV